MYEFQDQIVLDTKKAFEDGARSVLIVLPTGSGKTRVGARMARAAAEKGKRVLWVAHTTELVQQAQATIADQRVDVRTIQSKPQDAYDLVIIDECHHFSGNVFAETVRAIPYRIGLTATPQRADGAAMGDMFERMIVGPSITELTESGVLVPLDLIRPERALRSDELALHPVDAYKQHLQGRRTVVYAPRVSLAEQWTRDFRGAGISAVCVHGELGAEERAEAFRLHRNGEAQVLVNCLIATEGYDDPAIDGIIIARGVGSFALWLQILGRGLRKCVVGTKNNCKAVDLRGSSHIHSSIYDPIRYSLDGVAISRPKRGARLCPICSSVLTPTSIQCAACGWTLDDESEIRIINAKLAKYEHKRAQPESVKISDLAQYMLTARLRGYAQGWAFQKFKGIHGHYPPSLYIHKAKKLLP